MSATKEVLELIFLDYDGKNRKIRIPDPKDDLTSQQILDVMNTIIDGNMLVTAGGELVSPKGAKIVQTTTELFDITVE